MKSCWHDTMSNDRVCVRARARPSQTFSESHILDTLVITLTIMYQESTLLIGKLYSKIRRFQLSSLHTRHAFTCTPNTKDAKNYGLQNCSGGLVLFYHDCRRSHLPEQLYVQLPDLCRHGFRCPFPIELDVTKSWHVVQYRHTGQECTECIFWCSVVSQCFYDDVAHGTGLRAFHRTHADQPSLARLPHHPRRVHPGWCRGKTPILRYNKRDTIIHTVI